MQDMQKLLDTLRDKICYVTYQKVDTGELREMECTLNPDYIPNNYVLNQRLGSDIVVWALDRDDWRAVRVNTVKEWRIK